MPRYGPYDFYGGTVRLWFDNEQHEYLREYGPELVPQPSVTQLLRIIDRSEYLIPWSAKMVTTKLAATWPIISDGFEDYTKPLPLDQFRELLDAAKKAPREILEDAGDVGTEAHNALENAINFAISTNAGVVEKLVSQVKDPRAESCCAAALDWMKKHLVRWVSTERKIYSRKYEYAGTMDGLAFVTSCGDPICCPADFTDRRAVIDWKSANQMSISFAYQCAAYKAAYEEETDDIVPDIWILRLGKEDAEFEPWHISEDHGFYLAAFYAALDLSIDHEAAKQRWSAAKKARTARKRLAKKVEQW